MMDALYDTLPARLHWILDVPTPARPDTSSDHPMRPDRSWACTTSRGRTARIPHPACGGYCPTIQPGDVYLEFVEFPGGDSGNATAAGRPVRMAVCAPCAVRAGQHYVLDIPYDQLCWQGLL